MGMGGLLGSRPAALGNLLILIIRVALVVSGRGEEAGKEQEGSDRIKQQGKICCFVLEKGGVDLLKKRFEEEDWRI